MLAMLSFGSKITGVLIRLHPYIHTYILISLYNKRCELLRQKVKQSHLTISGASLSSVGDPQVLFLEHL